MFSIFLQVSLKNYFSEVYDFVKPITKHLLELQTLDMP